MAEITQEVVIAAMRAVEEDTISRCAKICETYIAEHAKPGKSKIADARVGAAAVLKKTIGAMPRKTP